MGKVASETNNEKLSFEEQLRTYGMLTVGVILLVVGDYLFKFPNNYSFGGVTGIAVVLHSFLPWSASALTFAINMVLLVVGFFALDKSFGMKTVYVSVLFSGGLEVMEWLFPLSGPLTDQPVLELIFAIVMPAAAAAIFFNLGASSGGTDIVAMILKKYTSLQIGKALMIVDASVVVVSFLCYGPTTGLFSLTGLLSKTLVIDGAIENINLCKYFTIVCDDEKPIVDYIANTLERGSTVYDARGGYSHQDKKIVLTVMKRSQAIRLRNFIRQNQPSAFMMIVNSSEIIGKGFRGLN